MNYNSKFIPNVFNQNFTMYKLKFIWNKGLKQGRKEGIIRAWKGIITDKIK